MDSAVRINKKLSRAGNIVVFRSSAAMKNVVTPDHLCALIGQKLKRVSHLLTMGASYIDRVDADRCEMDAA